LPVAVRRFFTAPEEFPQFDCDPQYHIIAEYSKKDTLVVATYPTERRAKEVLLDLMLHIENGELIGFRFPNHRTPCPKL
jgi:hypothetical protein